MANIEKAKEQLEELVKLFESGEVVDIAAHSIIPPGNMPAAHWSLSNRMLVALAGAADARGYRQWEEAGRHVKKGARAAYILGPRMVTVEKENAQGEKEKRQVLTGFVGIPVFRVQDTEGADLPTYEPPEPPPLREVADAWGLTVNYGGFLGRYYGYFAQGRAEIFLASHDCDVFFHELAHAAHGRVKGQLTGGQDWKQEVVAELSAAVLARLYGCAVDGRAYQYIARYAPKDVGTACVRVLSEVQKVLELILAESSQAIAAESIAA